MSQRYFCSAEYTTKTKPKTNQKKQTLNLNLTLKNNNLGLGQVRVRVRVGQPLPQGPPREKHAEGPGDEVGVRVSFRLWLSAYSAGKKYRWLIFLSFPPYLGSYQYRCLFSVTKCRVCIHLFEFVSDVVPIFYLKHLFCRM